MSYVVNVKRTAPGNYWLTYGRGQGKFAVECVCRADGTWRLLDREDEPFKTFHDAKENFRAWAKANYGCRNATPGQDAEIEPCPTSGPAEADDAAESILAELDEPAPLDLLDSFEPVDEYDEAILDAARLVSSPRSFMLTRSCLAEAIVRIAMTRRTAVDPRAETDAARSRRMEVARV